jgi:hypothetical protein
MVQHETKNNRSSIVDRSTREKQQKSRPEAPSPGQNASIASPKHIERLSYLESSQNNGKNTSSRHRTGAPWSIFVRNHTFLFSLFFHDGYTLPHSL